MLPLSNDCKLLSTEALANTGVCSGCVYAHPSSIISPSSDIGEGTVIWHFCHIMPKSHIGAHCHIGQNVVVQPGVIVGNGCRILNNVTLYSGVICEQDVFLGPSCTFTNVINPRAFISRKKEFQATLVKQGASIGANATILCGTTIGSYALVGAGSVVTKDVPDYAIVTGNPARQTGWISRDGFQLSFEEAKAFCQEENRFYQLNPEDGTVKPV